MRLPGSERNVMELLWEHGPMSARELSEILNEQIGWSKTTTYTVLTRCVRKGHLERSEPGFICTPVLDRETAAMEDTLQLLQRYYGGSAPKLVEELAHQHMLTKEQLDQVIQDIG